MGLEFLREGHTVWGILTLVSFGLVPAVSGVVCAVVAATSNAKSGCIVASIFALLGLIFGCSMVHPFFFAVILLAEACGSESVPMSITKFQQGERMMHAFLKLPEILLEAMPQTVLQTYILLVQFAGSSDEDMMGGSKTQLASIFFSLLSLAATISSRRCSRMSVMDWDSQERDDVPLRTQVFSCVGTFAEMTMRVLSLAALFAAFRWYALLFLLAELVLRWTVLCFTIKGDISLEVCC